MKRFFCFKPELVYLLFFLFSVFFAGLVLPKLNNQFITKNLTFITYSFLFLIAILTFRYELIESLKHFDTKNFELFLVVGFITFFAEVLAGIFVHVIGIENLNQNEIDAAAQTSNLLIMNLTIIVFAPVVEEFAYRYCVSILLSHYPIAAGLVSVFLFSFMHVSHYVLIDGAFFQLINMLPYAALGTGLYILYAKTGSIIYPIFLHTIINFIAVIC